MSTDNKIIYKIYKPTKTATQSGLGNTKLWYVKIDSPDLYYVDPLMGWTGSKNPNKHIILKFHSLESAISYTKRCGVKYVVETPKTTQIIPKSYTSNFISK